MIPDTTKVAPDPLSSPDKKSQEEGPWVEEEDGDVEMTELDKRASPELHEESEEIEDQVIDSITAGKGVDVQRAQTLKKQ